MSSCKLALALENPAPDLTGASPVNLTPDIIARLRWEPKSAMSGPLRLSSTQHVQAAIIGRQLRGEVTDQPQLTLATGGVGVNVSGELVPRWDRDDRMKFATNNGWGIGKYITDLGTLGGQDAVFDPSTGSLRALAVSSAYFGYERKWRPTFVSAFTYGIVNVSNLDIQPERRLAADTEDLGQRDVVPCAPGGYCRRVPVRHARQQERPAGFVEPDPDRLDLQILSRGDAARGRGQLQLRSHGQHGQHGSTDGYLTGSTLMRAACV